MIKDLPEMFHQQPPTLVETENITANISVNGTEKNIEPST